MRKRNRKIYLEFFISNDTEFVSIHEWYIQLVGLIHEEIVSHCILLLYPILVIFDTDYLSKLQPWQIFRIRFHEWKRNC